MEQCKLDVFNAFSKDWALVTAGSMNDFNTMTVSWGGLGTLWNQPVATIYIRPVRHTFTYLEENDHFTISFFPDEYHKDLLTLGTISGRDTDKLSKTALTPVSLEGTVGFAQAKCTLICKKIYHQDLQPDQIPREYRDRFYNGEPVHRLYIGQVLDVISL